VERIRRLVEAWLLSSGTATTGVFFFMSAIFNYSSAAREEPGVSGRYEFSEEPPVHSLRDCQGETGTLTVMAVGRTSGAQLCKRL
jgi:hypothetical protein